MYVTRFEIIQDRYGNCTVCIYSKKCNTPSQTVLSAKSNLVTGLDAGVFKKNMYASHTLGQLGVGYSLAAEIGQSKVVPMTTETVLIHLNNACGIHVTIRSSVNKSCHNFVFDLGAKIPPDGHTP